MELLRNSKSSHVHIKDGEQGLCGFRIRKKVTETIDGSFKHVTCPRCRRAYKLAGEGNDS